MIVITAVLKRLASAAAPCQQHIMIQTKIGAERYCNNVGADIICPFFLCFAAHNINGDKNEIFMV